jgi:cobalamin biosynthesis protein CobD/CbiB
MDKTTKNQFKGKFYGLAVQLNAIVLLFALSVVVVLLVRTPFRIPAVITMLILAIILSWDFSRRYRSTKAWLDDH